MCGAVVLQYNTKHENYVCSSLISIATCLTECLHGCYLINETLSACVCDTVIHVVLVKYGVHYSKTSDSIPSYIVPLEAHPRPDGVTLIPQCSAKTFGISCSQLCVVITQMFIE